MQLGRTYEEADQAALQAAIAYRKDLVKKGVLKDKTTAKIEGQARGSGAEQGCRCEVGQREKVLGGSYEHT